jgi:hypothetical protein
VPLFVAFQPIPALDRDKRRLRDVGALADSGGDQDHLAVPNRARLPEWLQIADQDRGVHQRDEMRARATRVRAIGSASGRLRSGPIRFCTGKTAIVWKPRKA